MARQANGTGKGGKNFQDRLLAANVRTKALKDILAVLQDKPAVKAWGDYKKQVVLKLAGTVLPRLNEHTGANGEPLFSFDDETKAKVRKAWGKLD